MAQVRLPYFLGPSAEFIGPATPDVPVGLVMLPRTAGMPRRAGLCAAAVPPSRNPLLSFAFC